MFDDEFRRYLRLNEELRKAAEGSSYRAMLEAQRNAVPDWVEQLMLAQRGTLQAMVEASRIAEHSRAAREVAEQASVWSQVRLAQEAMSAVTAIGLQESSWRTALAGVAALEKSAQLQAQARAFLDAQTFLADIFPGEARRRVLSEFEAARELLEKSEWSDVAEEIIEEEPTPSGVLQSLADFAEAQRSKIKLTPLKELDEQELGVLGIRMAVWLCIFAALVAVFLEQHAQLGRDEAEARTAERIQASEDRSRRALGDAQKFLKDAIVAEHRRLYPPAWGVKDRPAIVRVHAESGAPRRDTLPPGTAVRERGQQGKWLRIEYQLEGTTRYGWVLKKYFERVDTARD